MLVEGRLDDERARRAVGKHPRVLGRRKAPIQRDEHCSEPRAGKQKHEQNRVIEAKKRDSIRGLDAGPGQQRGGALDALGQLRVAQVLARESQSRLARRERRMAFDPV